jgi:ribosomal protein L30E
MRGGAKVKTGTFTGSTSTTTKVTCGFKPKYICYAYNGSTNVKDMIIYNADMSTTTTIGAYKTSSSSQGVGQYNIGASTNNTVYSIDSDGFTVQKMSSNFGGVPFHYFAIG